MLVTDIRRDERKINPREKKNRERNIHTVVCGGGGGRGGDDDWCMYGRYCIETERITIMNCFCIVLYVVDKWVRSMTGSWKLSKFWVFLGFL